MASPFDGLALAEALNRNGYGELEWRMGLRRYLRLMANCNSEVHLIGISLSGTLVTDLLTNDSKMNLQTGEYFNSLIKIKSAVLLSPFFSPNSRTMQLIGSMISSVVDSISYALLYQVSRSKDLLSTMLYPRYNNDAAPLIATNEAIRFGKKLQDSIFANKSIPNFPTV